MKVELVVLRPGIGTLLAAWEFSDRVSDTVKHSIDVFACENTMRSRQRSRD